MMQNGQGAAGGVGDHREPFRKGNFPKELMYVPGTQGYRGAWEDNHQGRRRGQRSGPLHRLHRLRVDLPRKGNNLHRNVIFRDNGDKASQVEPYTSTPPLRQQQSHRAMEMDGGLRKENRRQRAGHRAQRQSEQWHACFPIVESFRQADRPRICRDSAHDGNGSTRPRR